MPKSRTVAIVAVPGVQLLDVSGPLDVFAEANVQVGRPAYRLLVLSSKPGQIRSSSGVRLAADHVIGDSFDEPIDTLLIAGCPNAADDRHAPASSIGCGELRHEPGASDRFAVARFCSPQPACWTAAA